jgi:hypothetical protein
MPSPIGGDQGGLRADDSTLAVAFNQKRNGLSADLGNGGASEAVLIPHNWPPPRAGRQFS